jgi:hypothetical protein
MISINKSGLGFESGNEITSIHKTILVGIQLGKLIHGILRAMNGYIEGTSKLS